MESPSGTVGVSDGDSIFDSVGVSNGWLWILKLETPFLKKWSPRRDPLGSEMETPFL